MAENELKVRLLNACKTESAWLASNPILKQGEVAYSSDKNFQFKVGNNASKWSDLVYNKASAVNPLSIKLNTSAAIDYDGSVAKTITITAASIGASTSGHTHLYAGSSSAGGSATSALKLERVPTVTTYQNIVPSSFISDGGLTGFYNSNSDSSTNGFAAASTSGGLLFGRTNGAVLMAAQAGQTVPGIWVKQYYTSWGSWAKLMHSSNYTDYTVTKSGAGATGTWGISISGNAASSTKAVKDSADQQINTTYIKNITASGTTITYTKGNNTTGTASISDTRVYQSATTTDTYRGLVLGTNSSSDPSALDTSASGQAYISKKLYVQPSTGTIYADKAETKVSVKIGGATLFYDDAAKALNFNFS